MQYTPCHPQDYARLLKDCQDLYCETRLALMQGPVAAHMRASAAQPLPQLLRAGCSYLMQAGGGGGAG